MSFSWRIRGLGGNGYLPCLADMADVFSICAVFRHWKTLRNRSFNLIEFDKIKSEADTNRWRRAESIQPIIFNFRR